LIINHEDRVLTNAKPNISTATDQHVDILGDRYRRDFNIAHVALGQS
jgi:hypothetical protein